VKEMAEKSSISKSSLDSHDLSLLPSISDAQILQISSDGSDGIAGEIDERVSTYGKGTTDLVKNYTATDITGIIKGNFDPTTATRDAVGLIQGLDSNSSEYRRLMEIIVTDVIQSMRSSSAILSEDTVLAEVNARIAAHIVGSALGTSGSSDSSTSSSSGSGPGPSGTTSSLRKRDHKNNKTFKVPPFDADVSVSASVSASASASATSTLKEIAKEPSSSSFLSSSSSAGTTTLTAFVESTQECPPPTFIEKISVPLPK
jgi:hypothetical protein